MTITLKSGDLAYIDTMQSGLVPCKVISMRPTVRQDGGPCVIKCVRVTADRYGYKRGDVITSEDSGCIVPRTAVKRFRGQVHPRILPFTSYADGES